MEGNFAEKTIELCTDSASAEKLQNAGFKLLARLKIEDLDRLKADMQIRLINLCRKVPNKQVLKLQSVPF